IHLLLKQIQERCSCYRSILKFIGHCFGKEHGTRTVYGNATSKIGLFFKFLDKHFIASAKYLPVHMPQVVALVIQAMLGKLYRKAMEWTFVQANDKAFDHLTGNELQVIQG